MSGSAFIPTFNVVSVSAENFTSVHPYNDQPHLLCRKRLLGSADFLVYMLNSSVSIDLDMKPSERKII